MRIGIIGLGMVGGTLERWFVKNTHHEIRKLDPHKGFNDSMGGCEAVFICIPVRPAPGGQDTWDLENMVTYCKELEIPNIFVRSTVLPGTCDRLGVFAMPEFLTERTADLDMERLPILVGGLSSSHLSLLEKIFPFKVFICVRNVEAEIAKYTHNCMGALKVTFFNIVWDLCKRSNADFQNVKLGALLTGFIEPQHTMVPGPDGRFGYGGKCFPENISAMKEFVSHNPELRKFFSSIETINKQFRGDDAADIGEKGISA